MEKTLRLQHQNLHAIVPNKRPLTDVIDYTTDNFIKSGNDMLDEYRVSKLAEYLSESFPVWKRTGLNSLVLPEIDKYCGLEKIDSEGLNELKKLDFDGSDRKFVLLTDIFSTSGDYKIVEDEEVIVVRDNSQITNRFYIVRGGHLKLVRVIESDYNIGNLRIKVEKDSKLTMYNLYISNGSGLSINNVFIEGNENSEINVKDFYFGGKINVGYFGLRLVGKDAKADVRPYYLGNQKSVIDILYLVRFYSEKTYGSVDAHGVLTDSSKLVFRGIMDILSGANESEAHQSNHTLLLSDSAKVDAIPSLMVDENNVVASHAASSSPIDSELLFYLMTRGLSEEEAKKYIVRGIFEVLKEELEEFKMEGYIEDALNKVVGGVSGS